MRLVYLFHFFCLRLLHYQLPCPHSWPGVHSNSTPSSCIAGQDAFTFFGLRWETETEAVCLPASVWLRPKSRTKKGLVIDMHRDPDIGLQ